MGGFFVRAILRKSLTVKHLRRLAPARAVLSR